MTNMDSKNIYTCDLKRYENEIGGGARNIHFNSVG